MSRSAQCRQLSGGRLHLQHGPIDVVLKAWGEPAAVSLAYAAAEERFATILSELVDELAVLRRPISEQPKPASSVGRRMAAACRPYADEFVTPMAAVAGSVADEILAVMLAAARLDRAYVNDGGDIALHIGDGMSLRLGIAGDFSDPSMPALNGTIEIASGMGIGGVATSGARGRSFSLGIADSVTVLAASAAAADVAATLIANAADLASPRVHRAPASSLDPDSDLGERLVTVAVDPLGDDEIALALQRGRQAAERYRSRGQIVAAALMLQGRSACTQHETLALEESLP